MTEKFIVIAMTESNLSQYKGGLRLKILLMYHSELIYILLPLFSQYNVTDNLNANEQMLNPASHRKFIIWRNLTDVTLC
jgi:hypothetical protein